MSQTKAQLLDNIKDNVQLDARNALRFADTDSSHYVAFKAPATVSSNVTWTLPAADGSANYVLATDGSGTLSWIADPAGQWVTSGSNIYFTGGNVGIGDTSPSNPLSVTGASAFNGDVTFTGASYNVTWDKSADDLIFNDNAKAAFGTSSDLSIYHDGTNSHLNNSTGYLIVGTDSYAVKDQTLNEFYIKALKDGAVELYYDNSKRLETTSGGIDVAGSGSFTSHIDINSDSGKLRLGNANDLEIYHDGTVNRIDSYEDLIIRKGASEDMAKFINNGAVELYHNNVKKLETTSGGAKVTGALTVDAFASTANNYITLRNGFSPDASGGIGFMSTDHSGGNADGLALYGHDGISLYHGQAKKLETYSLGVNTNDSNIFINGDNGKFVAGAGSDLQIYHNGSHNYIESTNGATYLWGGGAQLRAVIDGTIELYHDGSKKLETSSTGVTITGKLLFDSSAEQTIKLADNRHIHFGTGADLKIYHDGSHSYIKDVGTGSLRIDSDSGVLLNTPNFTVNNSDNSESILTAYANGAVELWYDNVKKFNTTSGGCYVHGNLYPTSNGSGSIGTSSEKWSTAHFSSNINVDGASNVMGTTTFHGSGGAGGKIMEGQYSSSAKFRVSNAGTVSAVSTTISSISSERRTKENIVDIEADKAWSTLKGIKLYSYFFKNDETSTTHYGPIVDEVPSEMVVPTGDSDEVGVINTYNSEMLLFRAYSALQQAITKIETLETKVAALESA